MLCFAFQLCLALFEELRKVNVRINLMVLVHGTPDTELKFLLQIRNLNLAV